MKFQDIIHKIKYLSDIGMFKIKEFYKKYLNIVAIRRYYDIVSDKYVIFSNHISSGSANSVMTVGAVMIGIFFISTTISGHTVKRVFAQIELERVQLLTSERKTIRLVEIEKIKAGAQRDIMKYQVRIEETRAARNPYEAPPEHAAAPVNVYIDTANTSYVIKTSDGEIEIAVSTIKVRGTRYSPEQRKLMTMAFHIGKEIGYPETIQSLLLQESLAGGAGRIGDTNLPMGKRSYGVLQIKVATAKKVLKKHKNLIPIYFPNRKTIKRLRDEEIIIRLIQDDEFNIRVGTLNFAIHRKQSRSWSRAIVAYNMGQNGANKIAEPKKHVYYRHVLKRLISYVRPFNQKTNLSI